MELNFLFSMIQIIILGIVLYLVLQLRGNSKQDDTKAEMFDKMQAERIQTLLQSNEVLGGKVAGLEVETLSRLSQFEKSLIKDQNEFQYRISSTLTQDFKMLNEQIEKRLDTMNERVEERLTESLNKTNETFQNILKRLIVIDEAQKQIESLSTNIISLQDVLTDKKARGMFGEVQLHQLLVSVFGEKQDVYKEQYQFENGLRADAVIFAPEPAGLIAVDSKFPLDNYRRITDTTLEISIRDAAEKQFKQDVKKHIDDIASKYIIPGVTAEQAILFIPAEAVFAYVQAYCQDVVDYANKKSIWLTSPTTLFATLTTLQVVMRNLEREKYAHIIQQEIIKLSQEFGRYQTRWNKLVSDIEKVGKDVKDISTTSTKIEKRFSTIASVEIKDLEGISGR